MMIAGKLIGVLLGLPFGVFGVVFGLLVGTLIDQVLGIRQGRRDLEQFFVQGRYISRLQRFMRPAAAIGIINALLAVDDIPDDDLRAPMLEKIRHFFAVRSIDSGRMDRFWTAASVWDAQLNVDWLARVYAASSPEYLELSHMYSYAGEADRDFLFSLCHQAAGSDEEGISKEEYQFIVKVFEPMGLGLREIRQRLCSVPHLSKRNLAILGLEPGCSEQDLKKQYRALAARLHPDSSMDVGFTESEKKDGATVEFSRVQSAYQQLLWQFRFYE